MRLSDSPPSGLLTRSSAKTVAKDSEEPPLIDGRGQIVHNQHMMENITGLGIVRLNGPGRLR